MKSENPNPQLSLREQQQVEFLLDLIFQNLEKEQVDETCLLAS